LHWFLIILHTFLHQTIPENAETVLSPFIQNAGFEVKCCQFLW
jgi:hypothetical protein